jgi:hypothetical protein
MLPAPSPVRPVAVGAPTADDRATMPEEPLLAGPLYGLRRWAVVGPPGGERLSGPQRRTPWPDGGAWLNATCERDADHMAPGHDCVCGIHALHPDAANARRVLAVRRDVPGIVECDGPVEVHPEGFRARRGRPHALVLVPGRNAALAGRLSRAYGVELVEVRRPADLERWCRERGLGLAPAVVDDLLGAGTAQEWRGARRRRARLAVARVIAALVVAVALAALAYAALPDPGGPYPVSGRTDRHLVENGRPVAP